MRLEEAERRDHRRIGKELDLFSLQEDAGGGLVFWHPKGARIRSAIEDFWRERHAAADYELLYTPHIALQSLWDTSGHTDFYREGMYKPMEEENQLYQLKPMNCPFHVLIYKNGLRSHRDLPMRWAELGTVYRHEMSGALHGLMRVRGFTQDDAHIFCRERQIADEILAILNLTLEILEAFGFEDSPSTCRRGRKKPSVRTRSGRKRLPRCGKRWRRRAWTTRSTRAAARSTARRSTSRSATRSAANGSARRSSSTSTSRSASTWSTSRRTASGIGRS